MDKTTSLYQIYKYDFHKATQRTIIAEAEGIDGNKHIKIAQTCFASLFDLNTIDKLAKINKKGEVKAMLPNDVLAKSNEIFIWRVNNSQLKDWWKKCGKDNKGIDKYEKEEIESNPYCHVLIDNRPGVGLMAIEKSSAWGSKPDMLRDVLLENFNRMLADFFDLEMRIEARMDPKDIWEFVHDRLFEHHDYIRKVAFTFQNPKKINKSNAMEVKSTRLKAMLKTVEISDALKGFFTMEFDKNTNSKISQTNKDMAEMVRLCGENGYDINRYFVKDDNTDQTPLKMGPLWDFEWCLGNFRDHVPAIHYLENKLYFKRMCTDPEFMKRVALVHQKYGAAIYSEILDFYDILSDSLQRSQALNFQLWDLLGKPIAYSYVGFDTWEEEVQYSKNFFITHYRWLEEQLKPYLSGDGITETVCRDYHQDDGIFAIDGHKLFTAPQQNGLYIRNGKKYLIRK